MHERSWWGVLKEGHHLQDLGKWNSNNELDLKDEYWEGVSWVNLAQETDRWWAANTVFT